MKKEFEYKIIKKVLSKEIWKLAFDYFKFRGNVAHYCHANHASVSNFYGIFTDPQVPGNFSIYADPLFELFLIKCKKIVEKHTKRKVFPTYSYGRLYEKGAVLKRHQDRGSCEISMTLNLGGNPWPIYLSTHKKDRKITLKPGDLLLYAGTKCAHWRYKFKGELCAQIFLHYVYQDGPYIYNRFDQRPLLGLPSVRDDF